MPSPHSAEPRPPSHRIVIFQLPRGRTTTVIDTAPPNNSRSGEDWNAPAFLYFPFRIHSETHFGPAMQKMKPPLTNCIRGVFFGFGGRI